MKGVVLSAVLAVLPGLAQAGVVGNWTLRFDSFSPQGMSCVVDAPGSHVRASRTFLGNPILTVHGDRDQASITCTAPDGSRWRTTMPSDSRTPLSVNVRAMAVYRPGASRFPLYINGDDQFDTPQIHSFTRLP